MNTKIAIVGMSCRFPGGVANVDDFWNLLVEEKDAVTQIPADRFGTDFYQHPSKREPGKSYTFCAGVLDDVAAFDAGFFGISPREAAQMDPQQRLLLELAWEAFEDAGIAPRVMRGANCGVYIGVASTDYGNRSMDDLGAIDPYSATGNTLSIASNRLSYLFDLRGPSMSIDTACSSSLVALHQAVKALEAGEVDTALAGGVNLLLHPFGFVTFSKASMLSPRGRCRAFDATGDGYVRSEGGAIVVLKTLERAIVDGDTIHAVIAGTGVNSDGFSQGGISVPGSATQAALLRAVYERAGVDPLTVDYLEAHGTGTAVGDPIETRALIDVLGAGRPPERPLLIGSVKTNIGHLETASGMAGLFKAILCLKHGAVPRSLHFDTPNPNIDFDGGRLRVVERLTPLERGGEPLRIGVNSFGFGGTNAHVVLTEPDRTAQAASASASAPGDALAPMILSARSHAALAALAADYVPRVADGADWNALAASAAHRRQWLEYRAIVAPNDLDEARSALRALATPDGSPLPPCAVQGQVVEDEARVALVFSGNGSQWPGMGRQLLRESASFRAAVAEVDALWMADGSASLMAMLEEGVDERLLAATEYAQPLLFAVQVGVVRALEARGIEYEACTGHSVGEVAAAWATGALTLVQGVHVIKVRSQAQALTRGHGRMAAAGLGEAAARALVEELGLSGDVEVAGINSPEAVTLAGSLEALESIGAALARDSRFFRLLDLDYAFHSHRMDAIAPMVLDSLEALRGASGERRFVSTVTGGALDGRCLDAAYWWRNIREPVRFSEAVERIAADGVRVFIEIGPHSILRSYVKQTLDALEIAGAALPTLKRSHDTAAMLSHALLDAIAHGARVDRRRFAPDDAARRAPLPTYPWQRERHWNALTPEGYDLVRRRREHPLLGYRLRDHALAWENQIDPARIAFLADHVVDGGVTFPGAGFLEMALAAGREHFGTEGCALENFEIRVPVVFQGGQAKLFRVIVDTRTAEFTVETRERMSAEPWSLNVVGRLLASGTTLNESSAASRTDIAALLRRPVVSGDAVYANTESIGLSYGPAFRWVRELHATTTMALATLVRPESITDEAFAAYLLHPALTDSGFHPLFALLGADAAPDRAAYVPVQIERVDFLRGDTAQRVLVTVERRSPHSVVASFQFIDAEGRLVARLASCRFRRVDLLGRRHAAPARFAYRLEGRPLRGAFDASPIGALDTLIGAAESRVGDHDDHRRRTAHLTEVLPLLDVLAGAYALRALDSIGAFDAAMPSLGEHAVLVARLADMVVEDGLAAREGDRLVRDAEACAALPSIEVLWSSLLAQSPAHVAELTLLGDRGAALVPLLNGDIEPNALMTSTSASLVEQLFESSPTWQYARAMIGACVEEAASAWQEPRRLRVLEIGRMDSDVPAHMKLELDRARCDYSIACGNAQQAGLAAEPDADWKTVVVDTSRGFALDAEQPPYDVLILNRFLASRTDALDALIALRENLASGALVAVAEARDSRLADIVFGAGNDDAHATLAPPEVLDLLERAGFVDIVRVKEQDFDLEGMPTLVFARAGARARAASVARPGDAPWMLAYADELADPRGAFIGEVASELEAAGRGVALLPLSDVGDVCSASEPSHDGAPLRVVFVAPDSARPADGAQAMRAQRGTSIALARLVRQLAGGTSPLQLTVVTQGGAPFSMQGADACALCPEQATLWGLGRVISNEHPELGCRLIDVSASCTARAALLADELLNGDGEEEVLLVPRGRFVPRMIEADGIGSGNAQGGGQSGAAVLGFENPGSLRNLEWRPLPERELAADEVEIQPVASGLNFRDVMYAMGLLSDEAVENGFAGATIGMELSGRITRTGRDVAHLQAGDAVLGFASASFASRVRTRAGAVAKKPAAMSFEEAATIPTAFFTVYYALVELARTRRGERVLIHGGAGGVGIAAIQLARHLGAEVFASAGSREKREFVRLLGADHVLDSRSLAFADDVRTLTQGEGVDVVLNSLAGEAMVRGIDTLRPFGRFLELGKRDFYENSQIGLRPFRNNISYFGIDADQLMRARPNLTAGLFAEMMALFEDGSLHPLPYRAFAARHAESAFRTMQQARQIGKVLVTYPHGVPRPRAHPSDAKVALDAHASYLVIGGTGGFGLATARWMIERGARHVVLASRKATLEPARADDIARLAATSGARIDVRQCDVAKSADVDALFAWIAARGDTLKGVVHSAMHIDDGLIRNLDDARMNAVLAPKVAGAWNLHRATLGLPLDLFVLYSSATTYLGNPGQASYVAANTYLEALVAMRRASGLAGTAMAWGPLDDVGFLARNAETKKALQGRIGGGSITSAEALAALDRSLAEGSPGEAVARLDWQVIARGMPAAHARRYSELSGALSDDSALDSGAHLRDQVRELPASEARELVETMLQTQIARILHLSPERISTGASVLELGMDSLMGIELGMAVEESLGVKLSVMAIAEGGTVSSLAARIVADMKGVEQAAASADVADQVSALAARHAVDLAAIDLVALQSTIDGAVGELVESLGSEVAPGKSANSHSHEERA